MQNAHGWIDKETHPPSGADADEYGCVLVWHAFQGNMITGWRNALSNRFITHVLTGSAPDGRNGNEVMPFGGTAQSGA